MCDLQKFKPTLEELRQKEERLNEKESELKSLQESIEEHEQVSAKYTEDGGDIICTKLVPRLWGLLNL